MSLLGVHLFLGSDRARKLQRIQELERTLQVQPLDRHHLDAHGLAGAQLLALCRQRPGMSQARLVVVDHAHRLDAAAVAALIEQGEVIATNACVVLLVDTELSVRHPLGRAQEDLRTERFPGRNTAAAKPFALTDALGSRDAAAALGAVHDQLVGGKEPLELVGLIAWQVNRWVLVKRLSQDGLAAERIAALLGMTPWQVQRLQADTARRSLDTLQALLRRCWTLDVDAKSGRAIPELAVDQLVLETCFLSGDRHYFF